MTKLYEPARYGTDTILLNATDTAALLPYAALVKEIEGLLRDDDVQVPTRLVQALRGGGSLFVMPALDRHIAITKLITFTPANTGTDPATIQGDVVVFDIATGQRKLILDGPTVTARCAAAVSLLAAKYLAPQREGPLLIAGAQGRSHLQAFVQELGVQEVVIASRSAASADVRHEAGDLLQAGVDMERFVTLRDVLRQSLPRPQGPVLFKSCGWAGWDLAAARTAMLLNHW